MKERSNRTETKSVIYFQYSEIRHILRSFITYVGFMWDQYTRKKIKVAYANHQRVRHTKAGKFNR